MDLKMEVYSPNLELLGVLEDFGAVLWEDYAFEAGTFSVQAYITDASRVLLAPENILWIEGDTAGIIEHLEQTAGDDGPTIAVKGRLLSGILDRRVLWGQYDMHGEVPTLMYELVADCAITPTRGDTVARVIPGLSLDGGPPIMPGAAAALVGSAIVGVSLVGVTGGDSIRKQKTGGSLLETLEELGAANLVAFGVRLDAKTPQMLFWARPGVNRTVEHGVVDPVLYSTELDDVLSSEYFYDSSDYRNAVLVAGEGEGAARVYASVSKGAASGLGLRETFVDARDLQSDADPNNPMTTDEYAALLRDRGLEKLAEAQLVRSFSATVRTHDPTYEYGVDFLLGDIITVTDERLGVTVDALVEGVERAVSREGETLTLTLGYSQPTLYDILKRKAGK